MSACSRVTNTWIKERERERVKEQADGQNFDIITNRCEKLFSFLSLFLKLMRKFSTWKLFEASFRLCLWLFFFDFRFISMSMIWVIDVRHMNFGTFHLFFVLSLCRMYLINIIFFQCLSLFDLIMIGCCAGYLVTMLLPFNSTIFVFICDKFYWKFDLFFFVRPFK